MQKVKCNPYIYHASKIVLVVLTLVWVGQVVWWRTESCMGKGTTGKPR